MKDKRSRKEQRRDRQQHYEELESRHDAKALERFRKPAYQSVSVAEYLARKYDITAQRRWIPLQTENLKNENNAKKSYLRKYRKHGKRIKRIEAEIDEIRSMKMYPSMNNDGMPHGSNQNDLSSYAAVLQEREEELYREGVSQVQSYKDIAFRISRLEDQDERDVLFYRYIKGYDWWKIAQIMDYSERWIYELHGRALKKIEIS